MGGYVPAVLMGLCCHKIEGTSDMGQSLKTVPGSVENSPPTILKVNNRTWRLLTFVEIFNEKVINVFYGCSFSSSNSFSLSTS